MWNQSTPQPVGYLAHEKISPTESVKIYQRTQIGIKCGSYSTPSPYVDSGMDVVIHLRWRVATEEHVHRLYGIRVELYAKHTILDLRRSSLLITFNI